ncbi:hypothetical protein GCK72_017304 [Caenorhabditis remanei]|uniref:Uncharacterized protein n=1 Tax=Caenorhabditis remanei TaxID=31234 RepID=A0A6A5G7I9_CAERE|nr:hypothetical protein GCK72_017304 [Caenorhabditis remanei]KAF1750753.1 hypothetical protein GCK72_017304 [Caenorhabditis remanei]
MKLLVVFVFVFSVYLVNAFVGYPSSMSADLKAAGMSESNVYALDKIYKDFQEKAAQLEAKKIGGIKYLQKYYDYLSLRKTMLKTMPKKEKDIFENYIVKYENRSGY